MLEALFLSFSKNRLQTLQERFAPLIGAVVIIIIVIAIVLFAVWWYRYWIRKGIREYEKEHGYARLQL